MNKRGGKSLTTKEHFSIQKDLVCSCPVYLFKKINKGSYDGKCNMSMMFFSRVLTGYCWWGGVDSNYLKCRNNIFLKINSIFMLHLLFDIKWSFVVDVLPRGCWFRLLKDEQSWEGKAGADFPEGV